MNNKIQSSVFKNEKDQLLVADQARLLADGMIAINIRQNVAERKQLLADLAQQRECTKQAQLDLVYSKRIYRILVGFLLVLIVLMYGGLWYVQNIKEANCF